MPDGCRLALGGFAVYQHPMALVRELARQGRRDLTVVGSVNGNDVDLLAGAGCLRRVESSYVGLEKYGLAPNFRRRVERGELEMVDYPELLSFDRFRASQDRLTFWPCDYLGGTDILTYNRDIREFGCPLTGRRLHAVPPADPEITVIHAIAADERGNVVVPPRRLLPQSLDLTMARAARTVIVTVEQIVSREYIRQHARWVELPSYCVSHVVEAPWGAHPCRHRGRITRVEHPSAGSVPVVGPVIGLSESPAAIRRPAPRLGEHTDEVLCEWLGLPPDRIRALRADGVV